jgi:dCMP deaminase
MSDINEDLYYLGLAKYVSQRGTCPAKKVGAVLVDKGRGVVLSVGANGAPEGTALCGEECATREVGENSKTCRAIHAEVMAIINAARLSVSVEGASVYVTISPCQSCARILVQSGIKEVVASAHSPYTKALDLLSEAGVKVRILSGVSVPKLRVIPVTQIVEE